MSGIFFLAPPLLQMQRKANHKLAFTTGIVSPSSFLCFQRFSPLVKMHKESIACYRKKVGKKKNILKRFFSKNIRLSVTFLLPVFLTQLLLTLSDIGLALHGTAPLATDIFFYS